jgi:hypothetical protein
MSHSATGGLRFAVYQAVLVSLEEENAAAGSAAVIEMRKATPRRMSASKSGRTPVSYPRFTCAFSLRFHFGRLVGP